MASKTERVRAPKKVEYELRLYIAGHSARTVAALANLKRLCEELLDGRYAIEVIDLLEKPHLAKEHQILAIPTLVRKLPSPIRKVIGDLSNRDRVLLGLAIEKK